jgi:acetolactate decarboxylase
VILDEHLARHLHVESLRRRDVHAEHDPHVLFQASTIGALLDGAYDGDLTFAELAEHGDLGLGTLNGLDGEMIALDGRFYRADVDGHLTEIPADARTPFAAVAWFEPAIERPIDGPLAHERFLVALDALIGDPEASCAIRVEGEFELIRARSVPRQEPPYRPLAEVVGDQYVFELANPRGSLVGFRFPRYAEGLEVSGFHLHFATADRTRGGHVLECRPRRVVVGLDPAAELHVELPPDVDIDAPQLDEATRSALERVERQG